MRAYMTLEVKLQIMKTLRLIIIKLSLIQNLIRSGFRQKKYLRNRF